MIDPTSTAFHDLLNSGELYDAEDDDVVAFQRTLVQRLNEFNATPETDEGIAERETILREVMGTYGEGLWITPPVYANWGLHHVHVGKNVYLNFGVTFVDDGDIFIGDDCMFGPNVTLTTGEHPLSPRLRAKKLQFNNPIHIGNNVWVGAGAIILAGVTIGDNAVVGAGSVVTRDVAANTIVVGVPARPIRTVTEEDDRFYNGGKAVSPELLEN